MHSTPRRCVWHHVFLLEHVVGSSYMTDMDQGWWLGKIHVLSFRKKIKGYSNYYDLMKNVKVLGCTVIMPMEFNSNRCYKSSSPIGLITVSEKRNNLSHPSFSAMISQSESVTSNHFTKIHCHHRFSQWCILENDRWLKFYWI